METTRASKVERALERWQAELLDLTRMNSLLHTRRSASGYINIIYPEAASLYKRATSSTRRMTFYRPEDFDFSLLWDDADEPLATHRPPRPPKAGELMADADPHRIEPTLNRLRLRSRSLLREHGVPALFLAFGILEWKPAATDDMFRTPLVFVPVRLDRPSAREPHFLVRTDEPPVLNPAFIRKLELETGIDLHELPDTLLASPYARIIEALRQALAETIPFTLVPEDVSLGVFSFSKYTMYTDLEINRSRLGGHPVIRAIAGEDVDDLGFPEKPASARQLDSTRQPRDIYQILDADSSQQETIELVNQGANMVIQGPPGTGKSQTITNIIAESIARKKTVLFVSEKVAALQVVANRLNSAGFSPFYLDASSQGENRGVLIRDIYNCWTDDHERIHPRVPHELDRLATQRDRLQKYADALHTRNAVLGMSAYEAINEWAKYRETPPLPIEIPNPENLGRQEFSELADLVSRLVQLERVLQAQNTHPWYGYLADRYLEHPDVTGNPQGLRTALHSLSASAATLHDAHADVLSATGTTIPDTIEGFRRLACVLEHAASLTDVPPTWLLRSDHQQMRAQIQHAKETAERIKHISLPLLTSYDPDLLQQDLHSIQGDICSIDKVSSLLSGEGDLIERSVSAKAQLDPLLSRLIDLVTTISEKGKYLARLTESPEPTSMREIQSLMQRLTPAISLAPVTSAILDENRREELLSQISTSEMHQAKLSEYKDGYRIHLTDAALSLNIADLRDRFEHTYKSRWSTFSPSYRRDLATIRPHWISFRPLDRESAIETLRNVDGFITERAWFEQNDRSYHELFGSRYCGTDTNWPAVKTFMNSASAAVAGLGQPLNPALTSHLLGTDGGELRRLVGDIERTGAEIQKARVELHRVIHTHDTPFRRDSPGDFGSIASWLATCQRDFRRIWSALELVQNLTRDGALRITTLEKDIGDALIVQSLRQQFSELGPELGAMLGDLFHGEDTNWERVAQHVSSAERFLKIYGCRPSDRFLDILQAAPGDLAAWHIRLRDDVDRVIHAAKVLDSALDARRYDGPGNTLRTAPLHDLASWAEAKRQQLHVLDEWIDLARIRRGFHELGIDGVAEALLAAHIPSRDWEPCIMRAVWTAWLDWWCAQTPELSTFEMRQIESIANAFKDLEVKQWEIAAERIAIAIRNRYPDSHKAHMSRNKNTPEGLLAHESRKRQRHIPLRELFATSGELITQIKPCFIMTPFSVAQHLGESNLIFDLVIFDEASQILPADAIGAIGRGRQVVVVGDRQQLPPTNFFSAGIGSDQIDEDYTELPDSILDLCTQYLPTKPLLWHYRSRHEQLIAFSNRHFYDNRLKTFPSPDDAFQAIQYVHVKDGIYESGGTRVNRVEAQRVAAAAIAYRKNHPDRSLGVVTFSEAQMVAVLNEIDTQKRADPGIEQLLSEDHEEGFFVKNLENVQGDERDAIFFSVGYGYNAEGRFLHNFGPLNRNGGERRLNVAITRARQEIVVFASFLPDNIDDQRVKSRGAKLFKAYLTYAENGSARAIIGSTLPVERPVDALVDQIATSLESHGVEVVRGLGAGDTPIDIAIKAPGSDRYVMAIDCDGPDYYQLPTVRDRERLRPDMLKRLGWNVLPVRSLAWKRRSDEQLQKIMDTYNRAQRNGDPGSTS